METINKKVELLSPAGDFSCFLAAINAGADAVYLGGEKFGARAYANNFTQEEIIEAIKIAHLFDKKIYLTVNTLVKENEIAELIPYISPLYCAGLDGVIIQDIGVFQILKENFPKLELHASTQMTITGKYGANLLKKMGACRVVPARELSFDEIKEIKEFTGLEIETFIHGAMCYGYSGQCLFSSILGGRSGNRGRCAGPCRLPYQTMDNNNKSYPLSLKDMYTLPLIPEMIGAGIDSFKIEGRMKSPEYVAGVTSMYRKYIDMYLANPKQKFAIDKKDEELLRKLYIRSDLCEGYYKKHNGKDMVTIKEPGYLGCDDLTIEKIRRDFIGKKPTLPVKGKINISHGQPCRFTLTYQDFCVEIEGDMVQEASNRPLSNEDIEGRMKKFGDTYFSLEQLEINNDGCSFLPVKSMNELRRKTCTALEEKLVLYRELPNDDKENQCIMEENFANPYKVDGMFDDTKLNVSISTFDQLKQALKFENIHAIYIAADLFLTNKADTICDILEKNSNYDYYISFPHILRKRSYQYLPQLFEQLCKPWIKGAFIRNIETLEWLLENEFKGEYVADSSIYCWNQTAYRVWEKVFTRVTESIELNKKELLQLGDQNKKEMILYTRLPLMLSANCIQKTLKGCIHDISDNQNVYQIIDRYHNDFLIQQNCIHCYNILYNTVPLSLHGQIQQLNKNPYCIYRLDFSLESDEETNDVLSFYNSLLFEDGICEFPKQDYTNGHYKRGVE